ncbi:MAG: ribulose-phosphate 3-epimerase [Planctomycetia bacterium]|nr:ribulose-phosphate 3-epimerase [Planctomycetia bacterium]
MNVEPGAHGRPGAGTAAAPDTVSAPDTLSSRESPTALDGCLAGPLPVVLPALLLCDFGHLAHEVQRLEAGGAAALHLDIMDGRFVPQLTYGRVVVEAVRRATRLPLEVHLMVEDPDRVIGEYAGAGADILTVHVEALRDPAATLGRIADRGVRGHLAVSPGTPVERLAPWLDACAGVLVMSVEPGFGGQSFEPAALDKLRWLAARRRAPERLRLGVDGGVSRATIGPAAAAGAELIVAGSAVIREADYGAAIADLERRARAAAAGAGR